MGFGENIAKAFGRADDIERKLFLKRTATGEPAKLKLYGPSGQLGEVTRGWNLGMSERVEAQTGERFFPLTVSLVNDPNGELLSALKSATKVKVNSVDFKFLTKPSFLNAVPSYTFKVQPIGQS